jgi:hypothetical protein
MLTLFLIATKKIKKDEMDGTYSSCGGDEKCLHSFGLKPGMEEATWKM